MKIKYRPQDYEARLHGGIILYGGVPHKVVTDGGTVHLQDIVTGRVVLRGIDPIHNDLDISSPKLGYLNTDEGYAVYLSRIPLRRYKQSLDERAISESTLTRDGHGNDGGGDGHSRYLYSQAFKDTYVKGYPSFREIRGKLEREEATSIAASRDVAMFMDELGIIKVYHKLELIGWIAPKSHTVMVPNSEKAWVISAQLQELGWEVE